MKLASIATVSRPWTLVAGAFALLGSAFSVDALAAGAASTSADQIARGKYLTNAGDCVACHTEKGGQPFAGGLYMKTPFGDIATPNITPDKTTGIGAWTDDQFYRLMHEGIGHNGEYIYPVMPFPWYTTVTREDVAAIRAYLNTVPAVDKKNAPNKLVFPASIRTSLLAWREAFFKPADFKPDPNQSADVNRGDYLVNGLAHCGECHNGQPALGQSKYKQALQGGVIDNWYAPNISSDARDGIGAWSNPEIARYLKTGATPTKGVAAGPMAETVHSLSQLTDGDLLAIAAYLKTTPAKSKPAGKQHDLFAGSNARGGDSYLNFCASCHGLDGKGVTGVIPALDGNGAVKAAGPQSVINVVLGGLEARGTYAPMLAIGAGMTDEQIADVTNFVRQNWANAAPPTAMPGMVGNLRAGIDTLMNPGAGKTCPAIEPQALATAFEADKGGLRTQLAGLTEANMPQQADAVVARARRLAPSTDPAQLVNGITAGYCLATRDEKGLTASQRALRLGHFSELIYESATGHAIK